MIRKLSSIFGSKTKAQEILFLLKDLKEVVRQGFYHSELKEIEKFCLENNIFLVKSKFKVQLNGSHYSNKGIIVSESEEGMYFVYFSKSEEKSYLASYYELTKDIKKLGLILGYPSCCVDYFNQNFSSNNPNLEFKSNNLFTDLSKREQDLVLLSHFPCNSECKESIELAKNNLQCIKKYDLGRYQELVKALSNNKV